MESIKIEVTGNIARVIEKPLRITAGTVGLPVEFTFDSQWDGLLKTAVFQAEQVSRDEGLLNDATVVPWEVLEQPNVRLCIGVYGVNEKGSVALPTVWVNVCTIRAGANPGAGPSANSEIAKQHYEAAVLAAKRAEAAADKAGLAADRAAADAGAVFFVVDENGILSLKPEYRGAYPENATAEGQSFGCSDQGIGVAGSRNAELPRNLVIPDTVNGQTVTGIGVGAFAGNLTVERIVLPSEVTEIPAYCFFYCGNLKEVQAIGDLTSIGDCALHSTGIETVDFPGVTFVGVSAFVKSHVRKVTLSALTEMGVQAFANCAYLQSVDAGQLEEVPHFAFCGCYELQEVKSAAGITSVGMLAFCTTPKLSTVDLSAKAKSIQAYAFLKSGFEYDWSVLVEAECDFGICATAEQLNPTDIWSGLTIKECENPIPTLLCQGYEGWADKSIGTTSKKYGANGCVLFSFIHAYCGLTGQQLNSVEEFENIAASFDTDILNSFVNNTSFVREIGAAFGLTVEVNAETNEAYRIETGEDLQRIYDALADGKYVVATMPDQNVFDLLDTDPGNDYNLLAGHAALIYGVRADGRLLIAESSWQDPENSANGIRFALRFEHILHTPIVTDGEEVKKGTPYYILSKEDVTMKEVNEKLDALMLSASFRRESGTLVVDANILGDDTVDDSGNITTDGLTTVTIPCTSGAKLLFFHADDDTYAVLKAIAADDENNRRQTKWVVGYLGQCIGNIGSRENRGYMAQMETFTAGSKTYWQAFDAAATGDNASGYTFGVYGLHAGKYNWTAYYWDE